MILDAPKEETAPLALPDLAVVERDGVDADIVGDKSDIEREVEGDSDVIVEAMPVEGDSEVGAASDSSSTSSSSSSSTKGKAMKHMKDKILEAQSALEEWKDAFVTDCPDCARGMDYIQNLLKEALA